MEKGWYILKKRGGKIAHFFNSYGRSRCGTVKIKGENFRSDNETFGIEGEKRTYRCAKCLSWLKVYGENERA